MSNQTHHGADIESYKARIDAAFAVQSNAELKLACVHLDLPYPGSETLSFSVCPDCGTKVTFL